MKTVRWNALDRLIPSDVKDFAPTEELSRARALVLIILIAIVLSALTTVSLLFRPRLLPYLSERALPVTAACAFGYAAALWVFGRWASYALASNLNTAVGYAVIVYVAATVPAAYTTPVLQILLALPALMALMLSVVPATGWMAAVAITPPLMMGAGVAGISVAYVIGWEITCAGILLSMYVGSGYYRTITQRLNSERAKFEFAAAHDALTGLANRATFDRRLRECVEHCKVNGTRAALVFIDLDNFKTVNDRHGHRAGDAVLTAVAARLQQQMRKSDTVARLGGDEFAILIDRDCPQDLDGLLQRMKQCIEAPIPGSGAETFKVGCSYGKVVYPDDGTDPEQLLHRVDERMYEVKRRRPSAEILKFPGAGTERDARRATPVGRGDPG
jgi:diguanylate cyclase (GGDEF)-like protein